MSTPLHHLVAFITNHDRSILIPASQAGYQGLRDFLQPPLDGFQAPLSTDVGEFLPAPESPHARYSTVHVGNKNVLYVTVALTPLAAENGLYTLLGGSHDKKNPRFTPVDLWDEVQVTLEPGDALIWRGDLKYLLSPGGGGRFVRE